MSIEETFEPGIKSPYLLYSFQEGERGMKCRKCERVMTDSEWREKKRCFCGQTDVVEAIARRGSDTINLNNRRNSYTSSNTNTAQNNRVSGGIPINSTNSRNNTYANSNYSNTRQSTGTGSSFKGLGCIVTVIILLIGGVSTFNWINNKLSLQTNSRNNRWAFPMSACGDSNPSGQQKFYPVFVNKTNEEILNYIQSSYCRDAFIHYRKEAQKKSIQVASFRSKEKANEFAEFMLSDPNINSAEIGTPSIN